MRIFVFSVCRIYDWPPPRFSLYYSLGFTPGTMYMAETTVGSVQASRGILSHRRLLTSVRGTGKSITFDLKFIINQ